VEDVLALLSARRDNVKAGMKIDGIEMQPLKRLVVSFQTLGTEDQNRSVRLVEDLVDRDSESSYWEVEI